MKSETKELVEWCISLLKVYRGLNISEKKNIMAADPDKENNNCERSIKFLESLPNIESHLCRGGYIQDKNGTPCCDGELVYFLSKSQNYKYGYLVWDSHMARFLVEVAGEPDCRYIIPELEWFKKVELKDIEPLQILYFEKEKE